MVGWARRISDKSFLPIPLEPVNLTDSQLVEQGIRRVKPDLVIHSAAMSDVDACEQNPSAAFEVNAGAVEKIAKACASVGAILIAISTDYVFDGRSPLPYREEDPTHPLSVYARSKLEGEEAALRNVPRCLVLRVSGLFGSGRPNFVSSAMENFHKGRPVKVVTDQRNSPSYTLDLAEAIRRLVDRLSKNPEEASPEGCLHGVFHLSNAGGATRLEVAEAIAAALRAPTSLIEKRTWAALNRPAERPANSRLDCTRLARLTGIALRPWEQALSAFIDLAALDPQGGP